MKYLKKFNEGLYDIVFIEGDRPIIAYQRDVDSNNLSLMDGYYSGTAIVGSGTDKGSVDFSSPFHTGQVLHDDEGDDVEEVDFKFHNNISKSVVRKYLDDYVSKHYNGKIVKVYYH